MSEPDKEANQPPASEQIPATPVAPADLLSTVISQPVNNIGVAQPSQATEVTQGELLQTPAAAGTVSEIPAQAANVAELVLPAAKGKGNRTLEDYAGLDWSKSNAKLAEQCGVSRERIRQIRAELEAKRNAGAPVQPKVRKPTTLNVPLEQQPDNVVQLEQPNFTDLTGETAIAKAAVDYQLNAELTFDMSVGLLTMLIGPEWQPRILKVGEKEVSERTIVTDALRRYYESKQMPDIPPGYLVAFVCLSYAGPRFAEPNTKNKAKLVFQWCKVKVGGLLSRFKIKRAKSTTPAP